MTEGPTGVAIDAARAALGGMEAWLVGGAIRDRLLGVEAAAGSVDIDIVVAGDARAAARRLRAAAGGALFALSEQFGAWRVLAPDRSWHADLGSLGGASLHDNLAARDFTINAIAQPLGGGEPIDPFGGRADARARRLAMVSPEAFDADPLRVLRLVRVAAELDLRADDATIAAAAARAGQLSRVAPERVFAELRRIVCARDPVAALALMRRAGALDVVLPELAALRGVEQSAYHHLDVYDHTLAVLAEVVALERDPDAALGAPVEREPGGGDRAVELRALLDEPLADELTRGGALRLGALFHDIGKPRTQRLVAPQRIGFPGHDELGAEMARAALERLRASERLRGHVAALARHHLRLGFLVHERPLARRDVYDYLTACEPVEVDVTLLSVADRLATRGRKADRAIARHLELAREMLAEALRWRSARPRAPLVRGDELASALGIARGPQLGRLLAEIAAARFAGDVSTRDEAIALARRLI